MHDCEIRQIYNLSLIGENEIQRINVLFACETVQSLCMVVSERSVDRSVFFTSTKPVMTLPLKINRKSVQDALKHLVEGVFGYSLCPMLLQQHRVQL